MIKYILLIAIIIGVYWAYQFVHSEKQRIDQLGKTTLVHPQ